MLFVLYTALSAFLAGNIVRIVRISRMPAHLRWELYPIPRGPRSRMRYGGSYMEETEWWTRSMHTGHAGELKFILQEILFMKGVWIHNRALWIWSLLLHLAFYLLLAAAGWALLAVLISHGGPLVPVSGDPDSDTWLIGIARIFSWIFPILGVTGSGGLIVWRLASPRLRPYTSRGFLLNLWVILALFATGLFSLMASPDTPAHMIALLNALIFGHPAPVLHPIETAHLSILALFLLYFPFTHMTHMYMKYFTFHHVLWDDQPLQLNSRIESSVAGSLNSGMSWAAPHIRGDGNKTWAEAAAEGIVDDPEKAED